MQTAAQIWDVSLFEVPRAAHIWDAGAREETVRLIFEPVGFEIPSSDCSTLKQIVGCGLTTERFTTPWGLGCRFN
ncbi:hypothetical protein J6590_091971 [Homalodisca vitripennis]|nr:hypothetical protein J6590_081849 [Homalodisca vitripennis]KAG8319424.1 hypothetical protein J6590_091971 [Homalodisca vitripennis]